MRNLFWRSQQTLVSLQDRKTDCAKKDEDQFVHFLTGMGIKIALEEKTHNAIKLHKLCYRPIREWFGLSSNLAIRAIRRVVSCLTRLKGKRKRPKEFRPKSSDYDAHIFSSREQEETVSLTTMRGRIRIPMILGERQRSFLKGQNPTSANKLSIHRIPLNLKILIIENFEFFPIKSSECVSSPT